LIKILKQNFLEAISKKKKRKTEGFFFGNYCRLSGRKIFFLKENKIQDFLKKSLLYPGLLENKLLDNFSGEIFHGENISGPKIAYN